MKKILSSLLIFFCLTLWFRFTIDSYSGLRVDSAASIARLQLFLHGPHSWPKSLETHQDSIFSRKPLHNKQQAALLEQKLKSEFISFSRRFICPDDLNLFPHQIKTLHLLRAPPINI